MTNLILFLCLLTIAAANLVGGNSLCASTLDPMICKIGRHIFSTDEQLNQVIMNMSPVKNINILGRSLKVVHAVNDTTAEKLAHEYSLRRNRPDSYGLLGTKALNGVMLDIGANIGAMSVYMSLSNPSWKIFTFEPVPTTFFYLINNLHLNNVTILHHQSNYESFTHQGGVLPVWGAASDHSGKFNMTYNDALSQFSTISNVTTSELDSTAEVNVINIQKFLLKQNVDVINIFKIDCEGCEFSVIPALKDMLLNKTKVQQFAGELHQSLMTKEVTIAPKPNQQAITETIAVMKARGCATHLWNFMC